MTERRGGADMPRRPRNMPAWTRLILVLLSSLLSPIVLAVWAESGHWEERRAQLGDLALQQAQLLNGDVDSIADGARTLLSAVAQLDEVQDATAACSDRLRDMQRSLPMFAFIAALDT